MATWSVYDESEQPWPSAIYLDGQRVSRCQEANTEQGYVILLVPGADGVPLVQLTEHGPELVRVTVRGTVELEYAARVGPDGTLVD